MDEHEFGEVESHTVTADDIKSWHWLKEEKEPFISWKRQCKECLYIDSIQTTLNGDNPWKNEYSKREKVTND
jgi:hypothetical protein